MSRMGMGRPGDLKLVYRKKECIYRIEMPDFFAALSARLIYCYLFIKTYS